MRFDHLHAGNAPKLFLFWLTERTPLYEGGQNYSGYTKPEN